MPVASPTYATDRPHDRLAPHTLRDTAQNACVALLPAAALLRTVYVVIRTP
ncbi:hypothetical protein ACIO3O_40870 [Streptomyces sp. NPDC087440]|uniref:hypothetical protein n=1 Tax=Streptomyces sp. NPDC087440 TaxID=3365790 RepID=UPI00381836FB